MSRRSEGDAIRQKVREYLAVAEMHSVVEYPLDVRAVAARLSISPTTLYKYELDKAIRAAANRQQKQAKQTGKGIEQQAYADRIRELSSEVERERDRNKKLVARFAVIEANAARLGIDPEQLYFELPKPIRTASRAGANPRRT